MTRQMENEGDRTTDQLDSPKRLDSLEIRASYAQLGLRPGEPMRNIEAAYWRFARDLRGQAAIAPYTEAYEMLVNSVKVRVNDDPPAPAAPAEVSQRIPADSSFPGSKFGWPAT